MALYIHRQLKCLVTEENYKSFNIETLDDPELFKVLDIPEDVNLATNRLTISEPVFNEDDRTVLTFAIVTPMAKEEIDQLLMQAKTSVLQNLIPVVYTEPYTKFKFKLDNSFYKFTFDPISWYNTIRKSDDYKNSQLYIPVYLCEELESEKILDIIMLKFDTVGLDTLMREYQQFVLKISCEIGANMDSILQLDLESLQKLINETIPDANEFIPDPTKVYTFTKNNNAFTRTVQNI